MVLQSMSGQQLTLSELLQQLESESFAEDAQLQRKVQRIAAAGAVLAAAPSRSRLQNVRHHCSDWSIPLRVEGSLAKRPLKDLCDDLSDVLCRTASGVLCSRQGSAPEHASISVSSASEQPSFPASSAPEHLVMETERPCCR